MVIRILMIINTLLDKVFVSSMITTTGVLLRIMKTTLGTRISTMVIRTTTTATTKTIFVPRVSSKLEMAFLEEAISFE